jgi:Tol biopolymer transport system component
MTLEASATSSVAAAELIASTRWEQDPQISPDGSKIVFCSARSGQFQIWTCNHDGSNAMRLTDFGASDTSAPSWSPDGQFIAFNSTRSGNYDVYVMGSQGGPARQLTTDEATDGLPSWSQDGRWIYFASNRGGDFQTWKVPAEGGRPVQVTANGGFRAQESGDGRFLYYVKTENWSDLWRMPVPEGEETLFLEHVHRRGWALTEHGVYVLNDNTKPFPSIQFFDFSTGRLEHVAEVKESLWLGGDLCVAFDDSYLLYVRRELEEDIMLVENFQ